MSVGAGRKDRSLRPSAFVLALLAPLLAAADALPGQDRITAPSGHELVLSRDSVLSMLSRTRDLYDTLETDPGVVYYVGYGRTVPEARPAEAYPWHAVTVRDDSTVRVVVPGNLREADRAYFNYAVLRMRERAAGPDRPAGEAPCEEAVEREVRILDAFADGWIVARTLFGSPAFPPLAEIPFARSAGHLDAYAVERDPPQLEGCAGAWREAHPDRMAAYRSWREREFLGQPTDSSATATARPVHSLLRR